MYISYEIGIPYCPVIHQEWVKEICNNMHNVVLHQQRGVGGLFEREGYEQCVWEQWNNSPSKVYLEAPLKFRPCQAILSFVSSVA